MNKFIGIVIAGIVVASLLAFGVFAILLRAPSPSGSTTTPGPGGTGNSTVNIPATGTSAPGKTISLAISGGGTIQVKDFINDGSTVKDPVNTGSFFLGYHVYEGVTDSTASDDPPYLIGYDDKNQNFTISLLHEPLGETRDQVEQYLVEHLGIAQGSLCALNYTVAVPYRVNNFYAGTNLGFSGCPQAVLLP